MKRRTRDNNIVNNPKIGSIVNRDIRKKTKNYPCDVLIIDGQFYSNGRLSNSWSWKRILNDGTLGKKEQGYGSFKKSVNKYRITTIVTKINH